MIGLFWHVFQTQILPVLHCAGALAFTATKFFKFFVNIQVIAKCPFSVILSCVPNPAAIAWPCDGSSSATSADLWEEQPFQM